MSISSFVTGAERVLHVLSSLAESNHEVIRNGRHAHEAVVRTHYT
ncbi:hypothetical protein JOE11_003647 [Robbsia andropogonis]|nr:hypothetical protein [Robbsia andropogonis]